MIRQGSDVRARIEAFITERPFLLLVRHFARKTVGAPDTASSVDLGIAGVLAILALPGAFTALGLAEKYGSFFLWISGRLAHFDAYKESVSDEYFFLTYSMAVAGFVTVLRWDHLLPRRLDFFNLAPLPVPLRSIFLSNAVALSIIAVLFALDVNAFSGFFFPLLVTMHGQSLGEWISLCAAHWSAVIGLTLFTILALLALQGLLMSTLPDVLYRKASLAVRFVLLVFLFGLLVSAFVFPLSALDFRWGSKMVGAWWPPLWFLSFFQSMVPQLKSSPSASPNVAITALTVAGVACALSFTLSYRRYFLGISERADSATQSGSMRRRGLGWLNPLLRIELRNTAEIAICRFIVKTILRSETHLLFAGLWTGMGLLLALEGLTGIHADVPGSGKYTGAILAAPLIFSFGLVAALRFVFDIPAGLDANWLFRLTTEGGIRASRVSRTVILLFVLPPLVAVWYPFAFLHIGWWASSVGLVCDLVLARTTANLFVFNYGKIPCTCSFTAKRDRMLRLAITCLVTLALVIPLLVALQGSVIEHPLRALLIVPALAAALVASEVACLNGDRQLVFEDTGVEPFALLHLAAD